MTGPLLPPRIARALSASPSQSPSRSADAAALSQATAHGGVFTESPNQQHPARQEREQKQESNGMKGGNGAAAAEGSSFLDHGDGSGHWDVGGNEGESGKRKEWEEREAPGDVGDDCDDYGDDDYYDDGPLALPFLVRTWLGGTGTLVAPGMDRQKKKQRNRHDHNHQGRGATTARFETTNTEDPDAVGSGGGGRGGRGRGGTFFGDTGTTMTTTSTSTTTTRAKTAFESSSNVNNPSPSFSSSPFYLPQGQGVIYVSLGRMPQLDQWQLVTVLQALSNPSEALCWGGGGGGAGGGEGSGGAGSGSGGGGRAAAAAAAAASNDNVGEGGGEGEHDDDDDSDRLGDFRVLWALPREQREKLLAALLPLAPPPSFRLKVMGRLPHFGVSQVWCSSCTTSNSKYLFPSRFYFKWCKCCKYKHKLHVTPRTVHSLINDVYVRRYICACVCVCV